MNIYEKLLEIRKSIEYLQKTEKGNRGAMHVDSAVLLSKIRTRMNDLGLILFPAVSEASVDQINDPTKDNPSSMSFLFKAKAIYSFVDSESGEKLDVPWFITGKHMQDPAMAGGAALTYYERYFLLKFFQIPTSKDDPEHFNHKAAEPVNLGFVGKEQIAKIEKMIIETGADRDRFLKHMRANSIESIPKMHFNAAISALKAKGRQNDNRKVV